MIRISPKTVLDHTMLLGLLLNESEATDRHTHAHAYKGDIMQFIYRGIKFEALPQTLQTRLSSITGKYRGCSFQVQQPDQRVPLAAIALRYRGVVYLSARYHIAAPSHLKDFQPNQVDLPQ